MKTFGKKNKKIKKRIYNLALWGGPNENKDLCQLSSF